MKILLVRHGSTSLHRKNILVGWNNDVGMDHEAYLQIANLAEHLRNMFKKLNIEAIYTSPLPRAIQTAEIIEARLCLPLFVDENLKDMNMGDWEGKNIEDVIKSNIGKLYFENPLGVRLPNGETIEELWERVIPVVEKIRHRHISGSAIIVSHLEVIKVILANYIKRDLQTIHSFTGIAPGSGLILTLSNRITKVNFIHY